MRPPKGKDLRSCQVIVNCRALKLKYSQVGENLAHVKLPQDRYQYTVASYVIVALNLTSRIACAYNRTLGLQTGP